jgi:hypothetical protein
MRREKVHHCVLLRMRKKEKEKYWSHNSSVLPMKGPDQASFYYFNFKMVGTCLWSWVSIFAQPNSLPKSQPMEPKCVVMEDSHSWSGLVSHTLVWRTWSQFRILSQLDCMIELGVINQAKVWSYHDITLRNILEQPRLCGLTTGQYVWTTLKVLSSTINIKIARSNWSLLWCNFPSLMDHHHEFLELLGGVRLLFREFPWFCNVTEPAIYTREQAFGGQFCHPWGHQACLIINTYGDESASHPGPISLLCLMMIMMMAHKNGDADSIWENLKTYDAYDSRGVHHLKTKSSKEWVQSSQWYLLERLNNL